ncbi:MAG TPA: helix-turn-helix domain-containing protein [Bacteroidia bacterium]|nr:helix-turn-helix domain-containing protein [Bacteroidia bacterium]
MNTIEINPQFEHVLNFVNQTNQLVFLTGKAGTGKTTLLKHIRANTMKQMAVVAPTGVAAINAGGSTIHSFFQFPFTPFLPVLKENMAQDFSKSNLPALKYNSQRLSIFRKLELLVIDEISMVRADLLDQIDTTLRQTRKKWQLPFGGVQVMLIGDMHQLPPVVQQEEWKILSTVYSSPYFFDSLAIRNNKPVYIELEKIYRQKDQDFIDILNKVRTNSLDKHDFELLNGHFKPNLSSEFIQSNITLTTHNKKADDINSALLNALPGKTYKFRCKVEGSFGEKNYPAEEELSLKTGARVMFLKNNTEKNYYNGKIGIVTFINDEKIKVKCEEDTSEIEVVKESWTNVTYTINKQTKGLDEDIIGTFTQFPLRLAWAITIHKSQGLSFDKVIIDAAQSFSAGQVYVALSRCRGLSGLTLSSRINPDSLFNDKNILHFSSSKQREEEVASIFNSSRMVYIKTVLLALFDFTETLQTRQELGGILQAYKTRIHQNGTNWCVALFSKIDALYQVSNKFKNQLSDLIEASANPETDGHLQTRIRQAAHYFNKETDTLLADFKGLPAFTESKEAADAFNEELQKLFEDLYSKNHLFINCLQGFDLSSFLAARLKISFPSARLNVYENAKNTKVLTDVQHPLLYRQLLLLRDEICNDEHKPIYMVANSKALKELTEFLPTNHEHLLKITGFGEARVKAYGDQFLSVIREYMLEHDLSTNIDSLGATKSKTKKAAAIKKEKDAGKIKEAKPSSREQTFQLFKEGLSLPEIAQLRGYAVGTLEGHLTPYISAGEIDVNRLVSKEKQKIILEALKDFKKETGLNPVKSRLPDDVSFAEIRYMLAHRDRTDD